jgi:hypothetical protein
MSNSYSFGDDDTSDVTKSGQSGSLSMVWDLSDLGTEQTGSVQSSRIESGAVGSSRQLSDLGGRIDRLSGSVKLVLAQALEVLENYSSSLFDGKDGYKFDYHSWGSELANALKGLRDSTVVRGSNPGNEVIKRYSKVAEQFGAYINLKTEVEQAIPEDGPAGRLYEKEQQGDLLSEEGTLDAQRKWAVKSIEKFVDVLEEAERSYSLSDIM